MSTAQTYTSYTEVDTPTRLTVAASTLTLATLDDDEEVYLTYDFGADYFSGDFEHTLNFEVTAQTGSEICYLWALANSVDEIGAKITANDDLLALAWSNGALVLTERNGAASTTDTSSALSLSTDYYIRIARDEATGTYGTLYCYIYTDPQYMELVDTLTVTLTEAKDFRYLYAVSGKGDGGGGVAFSGTISDLALDIYPYTMEGIRTRVRDLLNEDTQSFWTDTQLNAFINNVERDIASKSLCLNHIDALTTTASTRTVAYTAYRVLFLEHLSASEAGVGLRKIKPNQAGRIASTGTSPQRWWESGSNIAIEPIPAATHNLKAYVADYPDAEMSANTAIPKVPPEYRPLIVLGCLSLALKKEKRFQQSYQIESIFNNELLHTKLDKTQIVPDDKTVIEDA